MSGSIVLKANGDQKADFFLSERIIADERRSELGLIRVIIFALGFYVRNKNSERLREIHFPFAPRNIENITSNYFRPTYCLYMFDTQTKFKQ